MKHFLSLVAAFAIMLVPSLALALDLSWTAPTQREDGSALAASEIAQYRIALSLNGNALTMIEVPGSATAYTFVETLKGKYCARIATVDADGLVSDFTSPVCRNARPNPPSGLRVDK